MVCIPEGMAETELDGASESDSLLRIFASPSTLPHLLSLGVISGFLYIAMKADLFGSQMQGSIIFLSLSLSYFLAAVVSPSRIGGWIFTVNHKDEGVLNRNYWFGGFSRLAPIIIVAMALWLITNLSLNDEQLGNARILLALLFIGMSVFQGISLSYGWVVYAKKIQITPRKSRVGGFSSFVRSVVAVLAFTPLVWWFGFDATDPRKANFTENIYWIVFLVMIAALGVFLDRYSKNMREREGIDGVAIDRAFFLIFVTSCWHLLGAWRRSPIAAEQSSAGMLFEEGVLMSISIILAVWSMAKRGKKGGWSIFQGQSAVFWGVGFGFIYAGSISSLTALSEGSLLTTTAIGHAITALVMIGFLPMYIAWIGKPEIQEDGAQSNETSVGSLNLPVERRSVDERTTIEDDVVELMD